MQTKFYTALDMASESEAWGFYSQIKTVNPYFKVGLELFMAAGPNFVRRLADDGAKIFLDLKFHDIPNTVAGAIRSSLQPGVELINVHATGGHAMIEAARNAVEASGVSARLLGVTVLTSLRAEDLAAIGVKRSPEEQVVELARQGRDWGLHGIVCSSHELVAVRRELPRDFLTVVPGIRPSGAAKGDQARVATPKEAAKAGADFLVVGRPIREARDPIGAARSILADLASVE